MQMKTPETWSKTGQITVVDHGGFAFESYRSRGERQKVSARREQRMDLYTQVQDKLHDLSKRFAHEAR